MILFFFFQKNPSLKKKICFLFEGVKVREDWLVLVYWFYKEPKYKIKKKVFFFFFFLFWGGGGGGGGGARVCGFFFTKNLYHSYIDVDTTLF